jgi:uncharacterized membrane protein
MIYSGLGLAHSGLLHTWHMEVLGQTTTTELHLLVLRPGCPLGYYLITPGMSNSFVLLLHNTDHIINASLNLLL